MEMRFEAWTRPETGTFVRRFPIRDITDWGIERGIFGHGSITIPTGSRLDEILFVDPLDHSNDIGSMIRAYKDGTHYYDFYATRATINVSETGARTAVVTGGGPGSVLERTFVYPKDYPENLEMDWVWGPQNSLLSNADMEDGIPEEDFEDLGLYGWSELGGTTIDATDDGRETWEELLWDISASPSSPITGAYSLQIPFPGTPPAGVSKTIDVLPGSQVRIQYNFEEPTGNGDRFLMFAADPGSGSIVTVHTANGWLYNGAAFVELDGAVRGAGASDGTTQTFDIEVTCGDHQFQLQVGCQNATTSTHTNPGYLDDGVYSGDGVGLSPWFAQREIDYAIMELDETEFHSGTSSMKFQTLSMGGTKQDGRWQARGGPCQYVFCEVGKQYDLTAWIYHEAGTDQLFRIGFTRRGSSWISGLVDVTVPTATWTQIGTNGVADQEACVFTVRWVNDTGGDAASPVFWVDDMVMGVGEAASTYGLIMNTLLDDAGTNHAPARTALAWLTRTWTDTLDADTVAWDQNISTSVTRGQTMRRVVEFHADNFGYEARMQPDPADHTDIQFDLYNPLAMGTDYTLTDGGAVTMSGVVSVGPILRREPLASYSMVEGDDQMFGESRNTVIETAWGEIEVYEGSPELVEGALNDIAARRTTAVEAETIVVSFQNPNLIPGEDYDLGDYVMLTLGDDILPSAKYRVNAISVQSGSPEPTFQVQFVTLEEEEEPV